LPIRLHSPYFYLELLIRSDRQKAIPLLSDLRTRHPKYANQIMECLKRHGYTVELAKAISLYHTSEDIEGDVQSAIAVLQEIAKPEDIATLKYRRNLPAWMNEHLVSVIRFQGGGKSVYPFVEAYYQEHVQGKKAHNHLTCVKAFVQTGERRAIPYLREIFETTERKEDASEAIGQLLLKRRVIQKQNNSLIDKQIAILFRKDSLKEPHSVAWEILLADQDASVRRLLHSYSLSRIIGHSQTPPWSAKDRVRFAVLARFGDVATRQLLQASNGCSLQRRYGIANLLEQMLSASRSLIVATAQDESADEDRRRTAQLALENFDRRNPCRSR